MRLCIRVAWQYRVQFDSRSIWGGNGSGGGGGGVEERERKPGPVNNLTKETGSP